MPTRGEKRQRNRELYGSIAEREQTLLDLMAVHRRVSGASLMQLTGWPTGIMGGALAHLQMTGKARKDGEMWVLARPVYA